MLNLLWILLGFALFMALIASVYAVNRFSLRRYQTEPFSLPNAALMLVANLLLFSAFSGADAGLQAAMGDVARIKLLVAGSLSLFMLVLLARRTQPIIALYAVGLMLIGSIAILPSLVFRYLARAVTPTGR